MILATAFLILCDNTLVILFNNTSYYLVQRPNQRYRYWVLCSRY